MDLPQPPPDTELRNIIDKLAQFVARNGPDFEQMTKNKQKGNPKFQFLYGGEFFNYYQFKVTAEQNVLKQQGGWSNPPNIQSPNHNPPPPIIATTNMNIQPPVGEIAQVKTQIEALQEQIKQSEQNLQAQHTVLMQQQQAQIEVVLSECEIKANQLEAEEQNISLLDLNQLLTPIIENCTKDSIQTGKSWILQQANSKEKALCIAHCLLIKVMQGSPAFNHRLHVIYLVNDVLHHCARKNAADIKDALESVVVPMFCTANLATTTDGERNKLDKLLQLWESKANYLATSTVDAMRRPQDSLQQYKQNQLTKFSSEINLLAQQTQATFEGYRAQHQAFVMHASQQIQELEQRLGLIEEQLRMEEQCRVQVVQEEPAVPPINPSVPPPQFTQPPPGFFSPPPSIFPDFSKPPPGFPPAPEPLQEDLMPSVPYYELPAGLMVPLIKLEDTKFKPLDPKDIRLPPPAPPNERLLAAVEAFYALPSHERPRDSEGWEKLGLYEYYKAKNQAKKEKDEMVEAGLRELSRSPSPVVITQEKSPSPPRRRYTSKSPSPHGRDARRSRSKSRSRTPPRRTRDRSERSERRSSRKRRTRSHSRSRSRSPSPGFRGPTSMSPIVSLNTPETIDSTNKGHQMLKRMGWGGSGLGLNEQGIDSPISGGDVRDRQDQFKGIGCNLNDPYENFRKNKGAAFITRMKARAEERAQEKQSKEDY